MFIVTAMPLSAATFGDFTYTDNGTAVTITGVVSGTSGAVTIPPIINGMPVTGIGPQSSFALITSVTIPASVTTIKSFGLAGGTKITSISVDPQNPNYSSQDGVLFNKLKTVLIQFPAGVIGSYIIPTNVLSIGDWAFWYSGLTDVIIPPSVTNLGMQSFYHCSGLTSITMPSSVTSVGSNAFQNCNRLTNATFHGNAPTMGGSVFWNCASGFTVYYFNTATGFTSPTWNGYPSVVQNTNFRYTDTGTSITITGRITWPDGIVDIPPTINGKPVTSIGTNAFADCRVLTSVTIPSSVTSIGLVAFFNCSGLTSITIPSGVISIGSRAFCLCTGLTNATIPSSVISIGDQVFSGCTSLTNAIFNGNAPTMGTNVFSSVASGFTVKYHSGATGFTSPTWNGYPAVNVDLMRIIVVSDCV